MKNLKQKILLGTLVASTTTILVGTILVFPPMIIIGGIGVGLSLRKRLFFKKKKQPQPHVIQDVSLLEPGQLRGQ